MRITAGHLRLFDTQKNNSSQYPLGGMLLIMALIFLSPFLSSLLSYLAFIICIYRIIKYDVRVFAADYAVLIPASALFKGATGMSLIVYICLIAVAWYVFKHGIRADYSFLFLFFLLVFLILRMQLDVANFLLCFGQISLLCIILPKQEADSADMTAKAFCSSLILTSIYAFVFRSTVQLRGVLKGEVLAYLGSNISRFNGPFDDPNFYMTLLMFGIIMMIRLKECKKIKTAPFVFSVIILLIFGILTYSKTFFLALVFLLGLWILWQFWDRKHLRAVLIILAMIPTALVLLFGENSPFAIVITRLTSGSGLSDFTTGRTDIFMTYIGAIFTNAKTLLFGRGLAVSNLGMDPHNLFLEIAYYTGIVGLILFLCFFFALLKVMRNKTEAVANKNPVAKYSALFMFFILYNTLHGLFAPVTYGGLFLAVLSILIVKKEEDF